ncbi:DUF2213 domain-containing protein [Mesorhizobium sp. M0938]|uniref:DUF2213 domain-containing protein n=1 Tax=unclassified Mesorhizobium TaxID=325217 RepID=UPI00333E160E
MNLFDKITLDGIRRTSDGYLVADAKVARTGIQEYRGWEVGKPDMAVVRVYRPEAEVFSKDALHSYAHRPVTLDHPDEAVTADNWRDHAIGQTGGDVARDGEFVRVPLVLMDAKAIEAVQNGKRELSMGYSAELVFDSGTTPSGEAYDAIQTNLRMNHLAVVTMARGGSQLKIGDEKEKTMTLKTVTVDGIPVEVTDQGAAVITTLLQRLADSTAASTKTLADHATAIAGKDAELAKKDAEIDDLKSKVLDAKAIDARVTARADLITKAKAIAADIQTDGKSDDDIRKAAVVAKLGDAAVKEKPQAYIDARFDILAEDVGGTDQVRDAITHLRPSTGLTDAAKLEKDAHAAYLARFERKKSA